MKLRHALRNSSSPKKNTNKGFALIATLTLMMLLAMLAAACTMVLGDSELDEGIATIKNMKNGEQKQIALNAEQASAYIASEAYAEWKSEQE